jgi:hypothetical protein
MKHPQEQSRQSCWVEEKRAQWMTKCGTEISHSVRGHNEGAHKHQLKHTQTSPADPRDVVALLIRAVQNQSACNGQEKRRHADLPSDNLNNGDRNDGADVQTESQWCASRQEKPRNAPLPVAVFEVFERHVNAAPSARHEQSTRQNHTSKTKTEYNQLMRTPGTT